MKHYFRLLYVFISRFWKARISFLDSSKLYLRVWPTDLDLLFHMNNGVYLSLMDLGRMDLTLRSGFYDVLTKNDIFPVLGSEMIRFRKSLKLFQKFAIQTQLLHWDEKYFYLKQKFISREEVYATAIVKARFLKKNGDKVDPKEIFKLLQISEVETNQVLDDLGSEAIQAIEAYRASEKHLLT